MLTTFSYFIPSYLIGWIFNAIKTNVDMSKSNGLIQDHYGLGLSNNNILDPISKK